MNLNYAELVSPLIFISSSIYRCAHPVIPALMEAMTVTKMPAVTILDTLLTPCSDVNANLVMLAMAISAERTQIWMGGPIQIWCVSKTPPTTAKKYVVAKQLQRNVNVFAELK